MESFEDYLGPEVLRYHDRVFNPGRPLKLLGINRQRIPANWKLMQENIRDPYHPGLLHTRFVTFGLWRADQQSQMVLDRHGRHACMVSRRNAGGAGAATQGVSTFKAGMALQDDRLLDVVPEHWVGPPQRGHDDPVAQPHHPAAGQLVVNAADHPHRHRRVRLRLDALRL